MAEPLRTTCLRDCPDACGLLAEVESGRVVSLRGDPAHPITRGFICRRTKRDYPAFLQRPDRIVRPRLRTPSGWQDIGWDEAMDLCADRLQAVVAERGAQSVLFVQGGGSLGLTAEAGRYLFEELGATGVAGGVCLDAGEWAQETDFGSRRTSEWSDLRHAGALVLWGRNLHTASPHYLPLVTELRARGGAAWLIDPLPPRCRGLAQRVLQPRPGCDAVLALAVARLLFDEGGVHPDASSWCDHLDDFRALCRTRTVAEAAAICDVTEADLRDLAALYASGRPVTTWIGGGLQRWVDGAETVRAIDALCAVTGQVGVAGAGVPYLSQRRRGLAIQPERHPRTVRAALLGHDILYAREPRIRFGWVQRANPVATSPDAALCERALRSLRFLVVVDAFLTDTASCAHLILPPALMLEHDDLVASYGHSYLGLARRVVPPPADVRTDLEIAQSLARRLGLERVVAGSATVWIDRMLAPLGLARADLARGPVRRPGDPMVAYDGRRFDTPSGRVNLITALPPGAGETDDGYPLHLLTVAPLEYQASQVPPEDQGAPPAVHVHPAAPGVARRSDGSVVIVRSRIGALRATLRLDPAMRPDTALVYRGGWVRHGGCVNVLVEGRETRHGGGAAYLDERARLE